MPTYGAALLFKGNRLYSVGAVLFDLLLSESHNFSNTVTQYNIEEGSIISDNIRNELAAPAVTGLITNFSLRENGRTIDRDQVAFEKIVGLWKLRSVVSVVTFYKLYTDVVITNISINKDVDTGQALIADFSFQEIKVVSLEQLTVQATVNLDNMDSTQNKQSAFNLDVGKQTPVIR